MNLFDFSPYQQPVMLQGIPQPPAAPAQAAPQMVPVQSPYQKPNMGEYYNSLSNNLPSNSMYDFMSMNTPVQSPADRAAINAERMRLEDLMRNASNQNAGQVEQMRETLNQYKQQPRGLDWTPALSFIDFLNKGQSNLASGYAQSGLRPETENQRMGRIMDAENNLTEAQNRATQGDINASRTVLQSLEDRANTEANARMRGQNMGYLRFREGLATNAQKDVQNFATKIEADAADKMINFGKMEEAFNRGDVQSTMAVLGNFARSVSGESGVLTDTDISRIIPRNWNKSVASFFAGFNDVPTEELPPDFNKNLKELLVIAKQKQAKKYEDQLRGYQKRTNSLPMYAPVTQYTNPVFDTVVSDITSKYGVNTPVSTGGAVDPRQRLEELRAKRGN